VNIDVDDHFTITCDKYQWILREWVVSTKSGRRRPKDTYWGTLEALCKEIINRRCKSAGSIPEVLDTIKAAQNDIRRAVAGIKRP